jgi:two-component system sensor histidine kinase RegB
VPDLVLRWLAPLRWLAVLGQGAALAAARALGLPLAYRELAAIVAFAAVTNLALARLSPGRVPAQVAVPAVLLLDTLLFTLLLSWSGGPDNPFSAIYALHVAMAALTGSAATTWLVAFAASAGYALLFRGYEPQHFWHAPLGPLPANLHAVGMWVAVAVVAVVMTWFVLRVTRALRAHEEALRRAEAVAARSARLASLATLAAGAAHELGSPLGTIALVARELERGADGRPPVAEDARLLRREVDRCRAILSRMAARAEHPDPGAGALLDAVGLAAALRAALGADGARLEVGLDAQPGLPLGARGELLELLLPLVRNALDASPAGAPVELRVEADARGARVVVRDRGAGMADDVLERAGEPFFTTKPPGAGTGLGLFVVRLLAERLGGELRLRSAPGRGTTARVTWPLAPSPGGEPPGERRAA